MNKVVKVDAQTAFNLSGTIVTRVIKLLEGEKCCQTLNIYLIPNKI